MLFADRRRFVLGAALLAALVVASPAASRAQVGVALLPRRHAPELEGGVAAAAGRPATAAAGEATLVAGLPGLDALRWISWSAWLSCHADMRLNWLVARWQIGGPPALPVGGPLARPLGAASAADSAPNPPPPGSGPGGSSISVVDPNG